MSGPFAALVVLGVVVALGVSLMISSGKRCTPGTHFIGSRDCLQFCLPDGKSVYPRCLVPAPMQSEYALTIPVPPAAESQH
jgi:hypothetical protein